jgi:uncharacterized protein YodC (DUF2158 family)
MSEFKAGDKVQLKTGSVTMTVARIVPPGKVTPSDEGTVDCVWFANHAFSSRIFTKESLEPAT